MTFHVQNYRKLATLAIIALLAGAYLGTVAIVWRAASLKDRGGEQSLKRSIQLLPWDAESHWQLGRQALNINDALDRSLVHLREAVSINPHVARYWLDIAAAYRAAGDLKRTRDALESALSAEPTAPEVAWEAANFYLAQN